MLALGLSAASVHAAYARIAEHTVRTPTAYSVALSQVTGADIYVKYENLQHTGAFKARGAVAKLTTLTAAQRAAGVVTMSAGNHAQGVAYHARRLGIPATIVMPRGTPFIKIRKTRDYGAEVLIEGETLVEAAGVAERLVAERGLTFVHPYDDADVIAGQGSVALEMLEDVRDLQVLIVPLGGGGLIAGCALVANAMSPGIEVVGVEPDLYPSMTNMLRGETRSCAGVTLAEGIAVRQVGAKAVPIVRALTRGVLTVKETSIEQAIATYAAAGKTVAEGAGAAALAALLEYPDRFRGRKVGVVLSGGNVDARLLSSILMRDLVRMGQVLTLLIEMPDKPGQLYDVAGLCARHGANVLEVSHGRFTMDLSASTARLAITIETRDQEHANEVVASIRAAGFTLQVRDPNAP